MRSLLLPQLNYAAAVWLIVATFLTSGLPISSAAGAPFEEWESCNVFKHMDNLANCLCSVTNNETSYGVNCDNVVFAQDFPNFPLRQPITYFSHKYVNHQSIPPQVFLSSRIPLANLDLSYNWIRRLTDKSLDGLTETLESLDLSHNLLGDQLNPIFSTAEFKRLPRMRVLNLGHNQISDFDGGILEGASSLQELSIDNNELRNAPSTALRGPRALKILNLSFNRLSNLGRSDFSMQPSLMFLNVSRNNILSIQASTFQEMNNLKVIDLSWNRLQRLDSDSFQGLVTIEVLDLSYNYLSEVPSTALNNLNSLRGLRLSGNLIHNLDDRGIKRFVSLETLDLSRNRINEIPLDFFRGMRRLRELNLGVNQLRTVPSNAFDDLANLQRLNLKDNNLLTFPSTALNPLTSLVSLVLDYNRISALVPMKLNNITLLSISNNLIREVPPHTFENFPNLLKLNFYGNVINTVDEVVLPPKLKELNLGLNDLKTVPRFQLPSLEILKLNRNSLTELLEHNFVLLSSLKELDLSGNVITKFYENTFDGLPNLNTLDLAGNNIEILPPIQNLDQLTTLNFSNNGAKEIEHLSSLTGLRVVDLSSNLLTNIKQDLFVNSSNLERLNLRDNQFNSFKGFVGLFGRLKSLDLSKNHISYVYPNSFENFVSLWNLDLSRNNFFTFPTEFLKNCQEIRSIDLSFNQIKNLNEMNFSNFPQLRRVDLSRNIIEFVQHNLFTNSSQLQWLNLAVNKLESVDDTIFYGLLRLELDLSNNYLSTLPMTIFERIRVQKLQKINLSKNTFKQIPFEALQKQYFFLEVIDLSENQISHIPQNLNILVNVKTLDLSHNPLDEGSLDNILSEPKTVRHLSLANVGLKRLSVLEMPFLRSLNVSGNNLSGFEEIAFKRTTLLHSLVMDRNQFTTLASKFPASVTTLDLSGNPLTNINGSALSPNLQHLKLTDLSQIMRLEKTSLVLKDLISLEMYNLPKLGYLDIRGLLTNLQYLEHFDFEVKDNQIVDQIHPGINARVKYIGLRGRRIRSISTGAFAGLTSPSVKICLVNTSLTTLPSILVPVPMSSNIILDLSGSKITNLSPPFLSHNIILEGLSPTCDCNAVPLVKYLKNVVSNVLCSAPKKMMGYSVLDLKMSDLVCDNGLSTSPPLTPRLHDYDLFATTTMNSNSRMDQDPEDDIIWSVPPPSKGGSGGSKNFNSKSSSTSGRNSNSNSNKSNNSNNNNDSLSNSGSGGSSSANKIKPEDVQNMDTLIIGIVGGVVGIIIFFVLMIICFVKMSNSSSSEGGAGAGGYPSSATAMYGIPNGYMTASKCTCSSGHMPVNMMCEAHHQHLQHHPNPMSYSTVSRSGKHHQQQQLQLQQQQLQQQQQQQQFPGSGQVGYAYDGSYMGGGPMSISSMPMQMPMNHSHHMMMTDGHDEHHNMMTMGSQRHNVYGYGHGRGDGSER